MPSEQIPIADARLRIIALFVTAAGFSTLHTTAALAVMVIITLLLISISSMRLGHLVRRLRWPGLMICGLVAVLPFASGDTALVTFGPLSLRAEGTAAATSIVLRFLCILAAAEALLGPIPAYQLVAVLRALGVPALMTDVALLTLRHIEDLRRDLAAMRVAMRLRGAPRGFWGGQFRATGWCLASLLVRSHARSERIYHAMILRGYGAPVEPPTAMRASRSELAWIAMLTGAVVALVGLEHLT